MDFIDGFYWWILLMDFIDGFPSDFIDIALEIPSGYIYIYNIAMVKPGPI